MITDTQIEAFRVALENVNREWYSNVKIENYFGGVTVTKGKKNAKYMIKVGGQNTVVCFVELETGNILKPASWAAPAKGARGNIATTKPQPMGSHWLYR
jgi:hypothetical protein